MLVVGDKEAEAGTVSVRTRTGDQSVEDVQALIDRLLADVKAHR
jgi:threonyl-tRNA synthetase